MLYTQLSAKEDQPGAVLGRVLYVQFTTIVALLKQMHAIDEGWRRLLTEIRAGKVSLESIEHSLIEEFIKAIQSLSPSTEVAVKVW